MSDLKARAEQLAKLATKDRFKNRLATAEQRNGYEVGWYEGYAVSLIIIEEALKALAPFAAFAALSNESLSNNLVINDLSPFKVTGITMGDCRRAKTMVLGQQVAA